MGTCCFVFNGLLKQTRFYAIEAPPAGTDRMIYRAEANPLIYVLVAVVPGSLPSDTEPGYYLFQVQYFPASQALLVTSRRTKPWLDALTYAKVRPSACFGFALAAAVLNSRCTSGNFSRTRAETPSEAGFRGLHGVMPPPKEVIRSCWQPNSNSNGLFVLNPASVWNVCVEKWRTLAHLARMLLF
jgi:hypothetical protein